MYPQSWRRQLKIFYCILQAISCFLYNPAYSATVQLTSANFDQLVEQHDVVFLNFYADWCRFSQILAPVFDDAANKVAEEFPTPGKVLFGKVDCDAETALPARFHISKYPTLKTIVNGQVTKKEYRGQRSAEALAEFVREQLKDPVKELASFNAVDDIDMKYRVVVGYFDTKESPQYQAFQKVAKSLKDYCEFYGGVGDATKEQRPNGDNIVFRPARLKYGVGNVNFPGTTTEYKEIHQWATDLCIPVVREITFENAEELTEEGLPFLILFHRPDDHDIVAKYMAEVKKQLSGEKGSINCLTADGDKFSHPLHHLGKSQKDLPLIAIDSFRHMYLLPDVKQMFVPGKLKSFIDDLHSGKLHREFHYGPDPTPQEIGHHPDSGQQQLSQVTHSQEYHGQVDPEGDATSPPESTFRKLGPSRNRYTLLKDEL